MGTSYAGKSGGIFISYRRDDTAYAAGWLFDTLAQKYGRDQVFKDVNSIQLGDDFVNVITRAVGSCDVLLALIGRRWLTTADQDRRRRVDDPQDFVRVEIEQALKRNVLVIPILVDDAPMPSPRDLPPSLGMLTRRQALQMSPSRFESDTEFLMRTLDAALARIRAQRIGRTYDSRGYQPGALSGDSESPTVQMPFISRVPQAPQRPSTPPAGWTSPPVPRAKAARPSPPSPRRRTTWTLVSVTVAAVVGLSTLVIALESGGGPQKPPAPPSHPSSSSPSSSSAKKSGNTPLTFTKMMGLLPASFRSSCHSNKADVNKAAGQTAVGVCTIGGVGVTYTAYASSADLTKGLNSLAPQDSPFSGVCTPQGDDLSIQYIEQPFTYGKHSGKVFCNYGNHLTDSIIAWTDKNIPLICGEINASPAETYEQVYADWKMVLDAE